MSSRRQATWLTSAWAALVPTCVRDGVRTAALVVLVVVGSPAAARTVSPCLEQCDALHDCCEIQPGFQAPCASYKDCRAAAKADRDDRIAGDANCQATSPGRCTIVLGCVRRYEGLFNAALQRCARMSFRHLDHLPPGETIPDFSCTLGRRDQQLAEHLCSKRCASVTPGTLPSSTTTSTTTTLTGATNTTTTTRPRRAPGDQDLLHDPCFRACLHRIDSFRACIGDCRDKCDGDLIAEKICRRSCRNLVCETMMRRCFDSPDSRGDPEYLQCCDAKGSCLDTPGDAPCAVTTTTTSTTTTTIATTSTTTTSTTTTIAFARGDGRGPGALEPGVEPVA